MRDEVEVGAEAARSENDGLRINCFLALGRLHLDARNLAVLHDDVDDLVVLADVNLVGIGLLEKHAKNFRADSRTVAGTMTAGDGLSAAAPFSEAEVGAEVHEPFFGVAGVFGERLKESGIVEVVSALHRVVVENLRTVVCNACSKLLLGACSVHPARSEIGIAPEVGHLLEHDDARSASLSEDCGREARAARTDNDDIKAFGHDRSGRRHQNGASEQFEFH